MTRALVAAAAAALAVPASAIAGPRFAIGLADGASAERVAARLERATSGRVTREHLALRTLTLHAAHAGGVAGLRGVVSVERLDLLRPLAFAPADPLVARQWYLQQIKAFDAWPQPPSLVPVRVAIVDSGIDGSHPEFEGRVAAARSFVGGSPRTDDLGHGTFVAGLIGAAHDGAGMAGIAFPAQLAVAKVVGAEPAISLEAEVRAIRWAVDVARAQVVNLSFAGLRDPRAPGRDSFSPLEARAVEYAVRRGALVVAAVGNADEAPTQPWPFAAYPAALPHVLGVSAVARDGSVPAFSARDRIYNDLAAPGAGVLSTFPLGLSRPGCAPQGYSDCALDTLRHDRRAFRRGEGTSFAAPQVAAAAALVLAVRPALTADQVASVLTRSAEDLTPANGCAACAVGRDAASGWGRLDVTAAVLRALGRRAPPRDRRETNDEAGARAATVWGRTSGRVDATVDFWDDQNDVYRVRVRAGRRLVARLVRSPAGTRLFLWRPGTTRIESVSPAVQRRRLASSHRVGGVQRLAFTAPRGRGGWYYLHVRIEEPGSGRYALRWRK